MKKLFSLLAMLALVFALAVTANGAEIVTVSGYCGAENGEKNLKWTLTGDGTLTISGKGAMADYYYWWDGENDLTSAPWGNYSKNMKTLVIEEGVTYIGDYAFYGCTGFNGNLVIPDSVKTIGYCAFAGCTGFTGNLVISDSVITIGGSAFYGCTGFTGNLVIPDSVVTIGESAFYGCTGFNGKLRLGKNIETIGSYAFSGCTDLVGKLEFPDSLISIGCSAFDDCSGFMGSLTIPDNVVSIGGGAFFGCDGFSGDLVIGKSVKTIGSSAFSGCNFIGNLIIPEGVSVIGSYVFSGCDFTGDLVIPDSVKTIENSAFSNCQFDGTLTIGSGVTTIGDYAFRYCYSFKGDLIIPDSVTSIGSGAFYNCGFDGSLVLPNKITSIKADTFSSCDNLKGEIVIPDEIISIGHNAFAYCSSVEKITIGKKVETIGNNAFEGCDSAKQIYFTGNAPYVIKAGRSTSSFDSDVILFYKKEAKGWTTPEWEGYYTNIWGKEVKYTVKYDANGGTDAPEAQTKSEGDSIYISRTKPLREGYTFVGWSEDKNDYYAEYYAGDEYSDDRNIVLYAIWRANEYYVSYDANGGTGAPYGHTKPHGTDITLSSMIPEREGYIFLGWATGPNYAVRYSAGGKFDLNEDTVLYAIWKKGVAIPAGKLAVVAENVTVKAGETVEVPVNVVNNPGFASVQIKVDYDKTLLTLKEIKLGIADNCIVNTESGKIAGASANDIAGDGTLFTLVFEVSEEAEACLCDIEIDVREFYNAKDKNLDPLVVSGEVEVIEYIPGDANGDGVLSSRDATRILQYLVDAIGSSEIELDAADYNGDGVVSSRDATAILRYLINA